VIRSGLEMRCVVQRAAQASVTGGGRTASIGNGLCVLVGIAAGDEEADARKMLSDLLGLKIFAEDGLQGQRWTKDAKSTGADILLVPQFTLHARLKSGRPSFHRAKPPADAGPFFDKFVASVRDAHPAGKVECGMFGECMEVSLVNSGPVTIILDTAENGKGKGAM
jgi:D-aminoacyl-tRNA deacylase